MFSSLVRGTNLGFLCLMPRVSDCLSQRNATEDWLRNLNFEDTKNNKRKKCIYCVIYCIQCGIVKGILAPPYNINKTDNLIFETC